MFKGDKMYHDDVHLHPQNCCPFLHLTVFEIWPVQDLKGQGHYGKIKGQIKVTP